MQCVYILFYCLVCFISAFIDPSFIVFELLFIAAAIPSIAVQVRRLHDINKSGWFILLELIPIAGSIVLLVWYATKTDPEDNQYGSVPTDD